ncbi:hypothetical protein T265_07054 [Opisthorchis viverrini]|uniref:Uncharacterized protein n=1 Tax=Opisthorchis viverrini TaxID=6198 RepID=A0A075ACK2_OPIVI|nr:hypothetical protein T265_07054 [Opisthorchis viverrini]KER25484.1 hypothetical protein T265_07054 [Opisthorchis viverrini]
MSKIWEIELFRPLLEHVKVKDFLTTHRGYLVYKLINQLSNELIKQRQSLRMSKIWEIELFRPLLEHVKVKDFLTTHRGYLVYKLINQLSNELALDAMTLPSAQSVQSRFDFSPASLIHWSPASWTHSNRDPSVGGSMGADHA